nr:PilZ domain-containing protein [Pseudaminobacter sp.]
MTSAAVAHPPSTMERRNFQRVRVKIYGRFMLEDRTEHPCQVVDMSPGNVALRTERVGRPGEKVIAYIDHIGRVEGVLTRTLQDGFAMTLIASERKRDKLAAQLTWLANKHELDLPEDRRHERVAPRNQMSALQMGDGRQYPCRIVDLSLSGAAVEIDVKPALGVQVILGAMRGQVVRHFEDGVAIEFAVIQRPETLDAEFNAMKNSLAFSD